MLKPPDLDKLSQVVAYELQRQGITDPKEIGLEIVLDKLPFEYSIRELVRLYGPQNDKVRGGFGPWGVVNGVKFVAR